MERILAEIQSGELAKKWIDENANGAQKLLEERERQQDHQIETVGEQLRSMMPWIKNGDSPVRPEPEGARQIPANQAEGCARAR